MDTGSNSHYIDEKWKNEVKKVLEEGLVLRQEIKWHDGEFPNGDILHIPTMGQLTARDYSEGANITVENTTSSDYQLTITEYKQAGIQITEKFKQDSVYVNNLVNDYKVGIVSALMRQLESDIAHLQSQQTASNPNALNGVDTRFVSVATNNVGGVEDFHLAMLALSENYSMSMASSAYINPFFVYRLSGISNLISQDIYGRNEMLKEGGLMGKMITAATQNHMLLGTIGGFQTHSHTVLDRALSETITATSGTPWVDGTVSSAMANMFVGTEAFIGAVRAKPEIKEWEDNRTRSDILHSTFRYGIDLFRPESLVVCLTDLA